MKKIILFSTAIFMSFSAMIAQNNNTIVVFSEEGEPFYLILNGIRQNEAAATNVKAAALNQSVYKAKVIFETKGIPDADKTLYMAWEGNPASNMEFVFSIKKDKKGVHKWKVVSAAPNSPNSPYANVPASTPGVVDNGLTNTTVTTTSANNNAGMNTNVQVNDNVSGTTTTTNTTSNGMNTNVQVNDGMGGNTNVTTTTSTTTSTGTGEAMNMGVNMNGMGINVNVNITDPMMNGTTTTTTTTTTTSSSTSYTSSGTSSNVNVYGDPAVGMNTTTSTSYTTTGTPDANYTTTNYSNSNTSTACYNAMAASDFSSAKKSIESKSFEDKKLTVAKQVLDANCMNTDQVKEVMDLFTFEDNKLNWAKYAYKKTTDPKNYYKINDGFTFEASIDELNEYISSNK